MERVYPLYLRHSNPLRLPDEQKVERDACVHQRVASRKEADAAWQRAVDMSAGRSGPRFAPCRFLLLAGYLFGAPIFFPLGSDCERKHSNDARDLV
jgi:hypothetical protein